MQYLRHKEICKQSFSGKKKSYKQFKNTNKQKRAPILTVQGKISYESVMKLFFKSIKNRNFVAEMYVKLWRQGNCFSDAGIASLLAVDL